MSMTSSPGPAIEYRFNPSPARATCPVCGSSFESAMGMWPHLAGAGAGAAVCGAPTCPVGEEITRPQPCDMLFEMAALEQRTLAALQDVGRSAADDAAFTVAEQFRSVSLIDDIPDHDRNVLQLAAIDLQYCQAGDTRIEQYEPRLVLRTCGEAAGELLLSGCGEILVDSS